VDLHRADFEPQTDSRWQLGESLSRSPDQDRLVREPENNEQHKQTPRPETTSPPGRRTGTIHRISSHKKISRNRARIGGRRSGKQQKTEKIQPAATDGYDGLLFPPEQSFDGHKVAKRASRARRISKIFDKFSNHSTSDI
jgi:hypothetical protein